MTDRLAKISEELETIASELAGKTAANPTYRKSFKKYIDQMNKAYWGIFAEIQDLEMGALDDFHDVLMPYQEAVENLQAALENVDDMYRNASHRKVATDVVKSAEEVAGAMYGLDHAIQIDGRMGRSTKRQMKDANKAVLGVIQAVEADTGEEVRM